MNNEKVIIKVEREKGKIVDIQLDMPTIQDAWMLSAALKKHFDHETTEKVRKELIHFQKLELEDDESKKTELKMTEQLYNLSLKIDTCKEFNDACIIILQKYFEKITGDLPPEDLRLTMIQKYMQQPWFRKNFGSIKMQLFTKVGMVFFVDHLHMLPILHKMMSSKSQ